MPDLATRLREYADGARPIAFDDVTSGRPRRARSRVVVAIAAAVVVIAVGAVAVLRRDTESGGSGHVTTTREPLPASCTAPSGCHMEPAVASRHLGFTVRLPIGIPDGWTRVRANLRVYPAGSRDQSGRVIAQTVTTYTLDWAPPGTDVDAPGTCPTLLFVRERLAAPGEHEPAWPRVDLGDGVSAGGTLTPDATCGDPGGPRGSSAFLDWVDDGISFTLQSWNADEQHVLQVARSLNR